MAPARPEKPRYQKLRAQFAEHGQEHVFCFWDELSEAQRQALLRQAAGIDLPGLLEAYAACRQLPERQPNVRDRINAVNFLLRGINGEVRAEFAPRCPELIEDLEIVQRGKDGGILKAKDKKDPYFRRTHTSDGFGYMAVQREPVASAESGQARPNDFSSRHALSIPSPGYGGLGGLVRR